LSEWDALVHLAYCQNEEGLCLGDLVGTVLLSQSAVTRMLERLEIRGWVKRHKGREDRRETYTMITAAGKKILETAGPTHNQEVETHLAGPLTVTECAHLATLLGKVTSAASGCSRI
jgi:DNA-binding MarR family transcriptional regulator